MARVSRSQPRMLTEAVPSRSSCPPAAPSPSHVPASARRMWPWANRATSPSSGIARAGATSAAQRSDQFRMGSDALRVSSLDHSFRIRAARPMQTPRLITPRRARQNALSCGSRKFLPISGVCSVAHLKPIITGHRQLAQLNSQHLCSRGPLLAPGPQL